MKILVVTGQLARRVVKLGLKGSKTDVLVLPLPFEVASLMTINYIKHQLLKEKISDFDLILVPGLVRGSTKPIENEIGIPTYKGPKYAQDLKTVINVFLEGKISFSHVTPACELLSEMEREQLKREESETRKLEEKLRKEGKCLLVGRVAVHKDLPMRVAAEIVDAPLLSREEIVNKAKHYIDSGADIIDIGMLAGESHPEKAREIVEVLKAKFNVPISIDSINPEEIVSALKAGADLVVSLEGGNMEKVARHMDDKAAVIIPYNYSENLFPSSIEEKIKVLEENIRKAEELGIKKMLCDPVLSPLFSPSLTDSLMAFKEFKLRNPEHLLFMGTGNVTELLDADSIGVNALIAGIASELSVNVLLTTEQSRKTRGTVKELSTASKMMYLAKKRKTPPKNLGLNLLLLKEKRSKETPYEREVEKRSKVIPIEGPIHKPYQIDPKGYFKVSIDRKKQKIVLMHFKRGATRKPSVIIKGERASGIIRKAIELNLLSQLTHSAYLGRELTKAELALKLGRSYVQDKELI